MLRVTIAYVQYHSLAHIAFDDVFTRYIFCARLGTGEAKFAQNANFVKSTHQTGSVTLRSVPTFLCSLEQILTAWPVEIRPPGRILTFHLERQSCLGLGILHPGFGGLRQGTQSVQGNTKMGGQVLSLQRWQLSTYIILATHNESGLCCTYFTLFLCQTVVWFNHRADGCLSSDLQTKGMVSCVVKECVHEYGIYSVPRTVYAKDSERVIMWTSGVMLDCCILVYNQLCWRVNWRLTFTHCSRKKENMRLSWNKAREIWSSFAINIPSFLSNTSQSKCSSIGAFTVILVQMSTSVMHQH